jgi:ferric-chelate reductase
MKITLNEIEKVRLNGTQWALDSNDTRWDHSLPVYVPIRVQRDEVQKKIRDYTAFLGNFDISQNYGLIINIYWLWALSWFGIWNKFKQTHLNARLVSPKINYLRSQISLPLFFNAHQQPLEILPNITTLLPTTAEAITLFGYFILNTAFLIHGYTITDDNQLFGQGSEVVQQIRLLADRSGILSFAHFPLLVLFAGRNNILIGLSELPYASFMMFHKWTARIMVTDALIHTFCYIVAMWLQNTLSRYFKLLWFVIGVQAIVAGIVMLLFAIHSFRVKHYEWFLITHVLFAIVFFVSCWEHCVTFGWLEWIYGAMCLWITDRLVRVYRLFRFGAPKAQIKLFSDDTFKVSVQRPHNWRPYPGCFVYLHFLHWSVFWQSHPFTIVDTILEEEEVTIYIKAKDGVTSRVMSLLQDGMITMRVSLEGPYGNQSPCENYDNVILFAGGNGIPGPFYHALHLAERSLLQKSQIRLIWVIRSIDSICWFEPELKRLYKTTIKCDIYITRGFHKSQVDSEPLLMQFRDYITFHLGRAPSKKILESEFKESQGSTAVVTCGPGLMCDEIRRIVATGIQKSEYRIDLYEELQVW